MVRDDVGGDADLERASLAFEQHEALRVSFDKPQAGYPRSDLGPRRPALRHDGLGDRQRPARFHTGLIRKVASGEFKNLGQVRAACSGIEEAAAQADIFGGAAEQPKATAAELRTLQSMESRIEQVAAVIGRGWKNGECQIAKKVDPNRSAKMADQIKAMMSALTVMEYDLRKASAAADLLQGMRWQWRTQP